MSSHNPDSHSQERLERLRDDEFKRLREDLERLQDEQRRRMDRLDR